MEHMRINELAKKTNISARAIRFYEQKGLIAPLKDPANNYRQFNETDADRLRKIISLREMGMPLEQIKSALGEIDSGDEAGVLYSLELQRSRLFSQLAELTNHIKATDRIIAEYKSDRSFDWEDIHELAEGLRATRETRTTWIDRWDFDRQAATHDELVLGGAGDGEFDRHPGYSLALNTILDWVDPRKNEKGLDIGTGTGNLAGLFLERGAEMSGIDQSKEMLKRCESKFPEMETRIGNFLAIPYLDSAFDFAVSSYAFHHLSDGQKRQALEEMRRVLKPHGRICIADLMFDDEAHKREYGATLEREGKRSELAAMKDEYYADRSALLGWFEDNGYIVKSRRLDGLLSLVYAVPVIR